MPFAVSGGLTERALVLAMATAADAHAVPTRWSLAANGFLEGRVRLPAQLAPGQVTMSVSPEQPQTIVITIAGTRWR